MQPTAAEVGEKSDVSIGWKTIGSRYAKPQAGDRRFRLAGNLSDCFREAMIETTRGMEQEGEEERERKGGGTLGGLGNGRRAEAIRRK